MALYHQLNAHEFEQTLGDSEGQGSLVCCSPWCCKELDMTWWLNNSMTLLELPIFETPWLIEIAGVPEIRTQRNIHLGADYLVYMKVAKTLYRLSNWYQMITDFWEGSSKWIYSREKKGSILMWSLLFRVWSLIFSPDTGISFPGCVRMWELTLTNQISSWYVYQISVTLLWKRDIFIDQNTNTPSYLFQGWRIWKAEIIIRKWKF